MQILVLNDRLVGLAFSLRAITIFLPPALADSARQAIPLTEAVVCAPDVRSQRPAGSYTQGRRLDVTFHFSERLCVCLSHSDFFLPSLIH